LDEEETVSTTAREKAEEFIKNNNLGKGFQKKPVDFFYYWYYTTSDQRRVSLEKFKEMLPKGPFVCFSKDKLSISQEEFRRIEFEYEKKEFRKRSRKNKKGKTKFI
jgi:hypothetical protein